MNETLKQLFLAEQKAKGLFLSAIWEYTYDAWTELQAEKDYYMLLETCQDLADGNLSGKLYPEINTEIAG